MNECILCGEELDEDRSDLCDACFKVLIAKYPKSKFREVKKWHKENAKDIKE